MTGSIAIGALAPDFELKDQHGQVHTLSEHRGKKAVLLLFYPFAFSSVCTNELVGLRDDLGAFENRGSTLLTVSCDSIFSQRAYADKDGIFFPLLSDFWPHGYVSSQYGVFNSQRGHSTRSSFVIDKQGRIAWSYHSELGQARDLQAHAGALQRAAAS